jgi:hypothetical protein
MQTTPICVFVFVLFVFVDLKLFALSSFILLISLYGIKVFCKFLWHSKKLLQRQGGYFLLLNPQLSPFKVHGLLMQITTLLCPLNKTYNLSFLLFVACCHFYCMCMVLISNLLGCMVFQIYTKVHSQLRYTKRLFHCKIVLNFNFDWLWLV